MIHTKYDNYQSLVYKPHSQLLVEDTDQFFILKQQDHTNFIKIPATTEYIILYNITVEIWYGFINYYIDKKLHNPPPVQTHIRSL